MRDSRLKPAEDQANEDAARMKELDARFRLALARAAGEMADDLAKVGLVVNIPPQKEDI